jgi:hypothetical protein
VKARLFAVVSWGCAGTHWLSETLDLHPQIRCFQNLNGKIARAGGTKIDGVEYAGLLESVSASYAAVGDVHGFDRRTIPLVQEAYGDWFRCAVLVREPVSRYRSQLALFRRHLERHSSSETAARRWNVKYVMEYARSVGVDRDEDDYAGWLVAHGANMLNAILDERALAPVIRMEDLVSSPSSLLELTSLLTGGSVEADADWAAEATSGPARSAHAADGDALTDEELEVARRIVRPEAWQAYRELGYPAWPGIA